MRDAGHRTPDAGRRTSDIGHRTSDGEKSKNNISTPQGGGHNNDYVAKPGFGYKKPKRNRIIVFRSANRLPIYRLQHYIDCHTL